MFARIASLAIGLLLVAGPLGLAAPKASDVPPLIEKLTKHKDPKERAEAAKELGHIGSVKSVFTKSAVPALVKALKDKDANVRREAAYALGEIKADPKLVVEPLTEMLKDKDNGVRSVTAESLATFGADAKSALPALKELSEELGKLSKEDQQKNGQLIQAVNSALQTIQQAK
jgi:HEAT repeat protein